MKQSWEIKKLGEVCDIICGQDYKSVKDDNGKYPIYGTGGIMGYASQYRCPANSVIIGRKGNINSPIYVETEFWNVDTAFGVVPKTDLINPKFFYLFCKDYDFTKHDVSVTIPSLRRTDILKIDVPVPPIAEQEKIVAELDCLSGIIEKKKQQLKEYDALAQSIFYEMFGDPDNNERGWQLKLWREVFDTQTGKLNANAMVENGEYPFFTCSKEIYHIDCYAFNCEALLLAGNNATANYDVKYYNGKFNAYQRTYVLTLKDNSLYYFFKFALENKLSLLQKQSIGGMTKYLTMGILEKISFIIPPLALQQEFASKIEAIEKQKELIKKSIEEVETLFNSRMNEYFN